MQTGARWALAATLAVGAWLCDGGALSAAEPAVKKTDRGAAVETDRYRAVFENGVLVSFFNKLTQEEYLDNYTKLENVLPHLPSGLGTQATEPDRESAERLYHWPWYEHPADASWKSQHYVNGESTFAFEAKAPAGCVLTYTGLTDGATRYPDESYALDISVEQPSGELLVTPVAKSPRGGVYASNLTVSALAPAITAEAPIFDGMRLDRQMPHQLYTNAWGGYWDYAFIALNGYKRGAVGIWTEDAELRYYKTLFYLVNDEGLSFSFSFMNIPPFEKLTESKSMAWRLQAYDQSWAQAAARFRDWRLKNVKIAPRAEWTKHISYVSMGVNAGKMWLDGLSAYLEGKNLDRTVTFAATIRNAKFDTKHWDNSAYPTFKQDMAAWKASGAKLMAYLQPMIVWGSPSKEERTPEVENILKWHNEADTRSVFQKDSTKRVDYIDQHNLGHQAWQAWFLGCVKNYIQECGADGVYHDQSYHCPIDVRGEAPIVGNMTSVRGMADYFYKAQTQNPDSIHGTEHMTEVNNVGASLGIGSGILWGTPSTVRSQRIHHPSPVSNALHYPNGVIYSFPHFSDIAHGKAMSFHWGHNIMEGRGEIIGNNLQNTGFYSGKVVPFSEWTNEIWLERVKALQFVTHGLRPVFPENWDRKVLSYYKGADGADFRYEDTGWGSAFVEVAAGGAKTMHYGRIHGVRVAKLEKGAIPGWVCYNSDGPSGLHPDRFYCVNPALAQPEVCVSTGSMFAPSMGEGYVEDGFVNAKFMSFSVRTLPKLGKIIPYETVVLHAPKAPWKVLVNGVEQKVTARKSELPRWKGQDEWAINTETPSDVVIFLEEPAAGLDDLAAQSAMRVVTSSEYSSDYCSPEWLAKQIKAEKNKEGATVVSSKAATGGIINHAVIQMVAVRAPAGTTAGVMNVSVPAGVTLWVNGAERKLLPVDPDNAKAGVSTAIEMTADTAALITVRNGNAVPVTVAWKEKAQESAPAATPAAK